MEAVEALRSAPQTTESLIALGDCQLELGDWRGARESYGEALDTFGGEGASPPRRDQVRAAVRLKLSYLEFEERHLWGHIERALEGGDLNAIGCAHVLRGRLDEAAKAFERRVRPTPPTSRPRSISASSTPSSPRRCATCVPL